MSAMPAVPSVDRVTRDAGGAPHNRYPPHDPPPDRQDLLVSSLEQAEAPHSRLVGTLLLLCDRLA